MSKKKVIKGTPKDNFFEMNPELEYITEFKELKENDPLASTVMWAIYMTEDPNSQLYKFKDVKQRRQEVEKNYLKSTDFDWNAYKDITTAYLEFTLTEDEKSFKVWRDKAKEMDAYVATLTFGADDDRLFKLFEKAKSFWATLAEIDKKFKVDGEDTAIKGQGELSARDKRYL